MPIAFDSPALTFGLALAAGMIAQVLARHLRVPGIVLLLVSGVLLGPDGAGVIQPQSLGPALRLMVSASVAVILFEGGLHLDIARLRSEAPTIRRLVTIGALITGVAAAVTARLLMQWSWDVAIPFGALVTVTGPTVIGPLLRRIRVRRNIHTILEAEGVLIDPIGAILAVVALEVVLSQELSTAAQGLLGIPTRLIFGTVLGAAGGLLIGKLLQRDVVPDGLESITTLSLLLALHALAEAVLPESGIMAAPVAGVVVGNMPLRPDRELREFKQQLSVLLVGLLFVLLAADVRLAEVMALGWRGWATVLVLMLIVRPLDVAICTYGSTLTWRERGFLAWLGPRGIVAAAVASLFAEHLIAEGMAEGLELRALVFLVIAVTVVVQGLTGGFIAGLLQVRHPTDRGYIIAGSSPLARAVGRVLTRHGEDVVLIDSDPVLVDAALQSQLPALVGNVLDDAVLEQADILGRRGVVSLIGNHSTSLLFAEKARRDFRVPHAYLAVRPEHATVATRQAHRIGAGVLFGQATDSGEWSRLLAAGEARVLEWRYTGGSEGSVSELLAAGGIAGGSILFVYVLRRGRGSVIDEHTRLRTDDVVTLILPQGARIPAEFKPESDSTPQLV